MKKTPPRGPRATRFALGGDEFAVLSFPVGKTAPPSTGITPAEQSVLALVLEGRSNSEIAAERSSSPRTVANQVRSLFAKLKVSSRAELVALWSTKYGRRMY